MTRLFCLVALFFIMPLAMAAEPGESSSSSQIERKCEKVLTGSMANMIRNKVRENSEKVFASRFAKLACPQISELNEKEKENAVLAALAAYAYVETGCNSNLKFVQENRLGRKFPRKGIFGLLEEGSHQEEFSKGTACTFGADDREMNQAACIVSLLTAKDDLQIRGELPYFRVTKIWPKDRRIQLRSATSRVMPNCKTPTQPTAVPAQENSTKTGPR